LVEEIKRDDWLKEKLTLLIILSVVIIFISIVGYLLPDIVSYCNPVLKGIPDIFYDGFARQLNHVLLTIDTIFFSIWFRVGTIILILGLCYATINYEVSSKKILGFSIFNWLYCSIFISFLFKLAYYVVFFRGYWMGGCG